MKPLISLCLWAIYTSQSATAAFLTPSLPASFTKVTPSFTTGTLRTRPQPSSLDYHHRVGHPMTTISSPSSSSFSSSTILRKSSSDPDVGEGGRRSLNPWILAVWVAFLGYAFLLAPGSSPEAKAKDAELLMAMVSNPFTPAAPPVFSAIFNALGIMPFVYSCLLLPGSRQQKPPALPFCLGSLALGFFALGPYLSVREWRPYPAPPEAGWLASAVENKIAAGGALVSAVGLLYYALTGGDFATFGESWASFVQVWKSQMFVHVSTLDLTVLSLLVADPMREDMLRREWFSPSKLVAFSIVPVIGPCLYLLLRPALPKEETD